MTRWPTVRLDDIADVRAGNPAPQDARDFENGTLSFVRMQDVGRLHLSTDLRSTVDKLTSEAANRLRLRLFPRGTLLIPKSGASIDLNHRALLGAPAYVVSHLAAVVPDERRIDPKFLFYWSTVYDPRAQAQTTSLPSLPLSLLASAHVPLPPLDEQRRIVGVLDRAAAITRRAEAARARARTLTPALFLQTFGDPATNPMGWPVVPLGSVASVGSGSGFPKEQQGRTGEPYPFLKVSDMNLPGNAVRITSWNNTISEHVRRKLHATLFKEGSVIFPKIGAAIATNKKRVLSVPSCVDNNVMAVTFGDAVDGAYGVALFRSKNISDFASTSDPPSMRKLTVEAWDIPLPPLALQTRFAERVRAIEAAAAALDRAATRAAALEASLAYQLLGP